MHTSDSHQRPFYRDRIVSKDLVSFSVAIEETDLLILILWHRFEILIDRVFALAHNLWKEKGHPQISVYRCQRKIDLEQAEVKQLAKLQTFIEGFQTAGRYPGVVQRYESVDEFEKRIRRDLIALLHTCVGQPK